MLWYKLFHGKKFLRDVEALNGQLPAIGHVIAFERPGDPFFGESYKVLEVTHAYPAEGLPEIRVRCANL